ncbi:DUF6166 domain-containing protein [Zavarzinella formosa]|uniref:DUF6166 domain-containing protein n=1 Tax=Zavarzinella formosa TaxID=360055 RepID=UPI000497CFC4|nr:DUF6166 domain-containing protein [Zavarzinella formosa]
MRHYVGDRNPDGCEVMVLDTTHEGGGYPLDPRNDLRNHSPDGFEFGYSGSGPSQLSLAILADVLRDDKLADRLHIDFKNKVISRLDGNTFSLSEEDVRMAVAALAAGKKR